MTTTKVNNFSVNSLSQADKTNLKKMFNELNDSSIRIEAERDLQKDTIKAISDKYNIDKKLIRKVAKTYYNLSFAQEQEVQKQFEELYSMVLVGGFKASPGVTLVETDTTEVSF